jgi:hypothetical protein
MAGKRDVKARCPVPLAEVIVYNTTGIAVTFASVFGTSLVKGPVFEESEAMRAVTELVEAAQAGDSEAYATLIERFQQMAYALAYRSLGDHHLAQDVVQEAAIEAFVHLSQLKEPKAFPGWLRQIVFRQCTRVTWCIMGRQRTSCAPRRSSDRRSAIVSSAGWCMDFFLPFLLWLCSGQRLKRSLLSALLAHDSASRKREPSTSFPTW